MFQEWIDDKGDSILESSDGIKLLVDILRLKNIAESKELYSKVLDLLEKSADKQYFSQALDELWFIRYDIK